MKITYTTTRQQIAPAESETEQTRKTSESSQQTSQTRSSDSLETGQTGTAFQQIIVEANQSAQIDSTPRLDLANQIDTGKLANLKEKLEVTSEAAKSKAEQLLGPGAGSGKKFNGVLGELSGGQTGRDRMQELVGPAGGGVIASRTGMLSDDEKKTEGSSWGTRLWEWARDVVMNNTKTGAGTVGSTVAGTANTVLTANTDSPESKGNEFTGWATFLNMRDGKYYDRKIEGAMGGTEQEPHPEAQEGRSSSVLTAEELRGVSAVINSQIEPDPEAEEAGSGGPVNYQATPEGAISVLAEFADGQQPAVSQQISSLQIKEIQARIGSKIEE